LSCVPHPLCPTMPSETLTSCWTSNDDGGPTSDNTRNKALRIMGCDTGPGGDHRAHGFRSTASTLLNEEGAFDGHVVEAQLVTTRRKKRRRRDEVVRRQLGKGHKNKVPGIYNRAAYRAERVRLMQHWSDRLDGLPTVRPPSRCADRRPSLLSFRPSAAKRDIHPRCRGRSWSCLPSCRP
jgi:hypothetical protein